ncbi:ankyrin repeat protein [Ophiocordyceps sinensis CO18]|uniref:Ankyrin repeat protein n=1 Tax=Ophiocordyceps sinensis (strain Co18 / CGMCC 3.14243) TaxID=911162 RepID=T5A8I1_OPHSC|nr:ankyrin repeat protein [Ophiocordyceps sinensis CO18]
MIRAPGLQESIKTEIVSSVRGMFLLAKLHLDSLMDKTSVKAIRSALEELPKGSGAYNEAFEMAMKRVETQAPGHRALAKQALAWIVCAKRPLNTLELQHALAVEACHTRFEQEALPDIEIMVSVCAGLIVMDKKSQFVRPVHYTTQQYFAETRTAWFPEAEVDITNKSCASYILFDDFESGPCRRPSDLQLRLSRYSLFKYAAQKWGDHAREAGALPDHVTRLLAQSSNLNAAYQVMETEDGGLGRSFNLRFRPNEEEYVYISPLHVAAFFGLCEAAKSLVDVGDGVNSTDKYGQTPLLYAAAKGHEPMVGLLQENGADINTRSHECQTPLLLAIKNGNLSIVQFLIRSGANTALRDNDAPTTLSLAVEHGHTAIVELLLDHYSQSITTTKDQDDNKHPSRSNKTELLATLHV